MPVKLPRRQKMEPGSRFWETLVSATPEYEVVVIGGGSAGYAAARTAATLGARTAVIEGGAEVGGLCILRGCMPSKALLESAHRWHEIGRAREFGLVAKQVEVKMECIQQRKQHLIGGFADYRRKQLRGGKFDFLRGRASFLDAQTLLLDRAGVQSLVTARTFIITTGSTIARAPIPGLWETGCLTSDSALSLDRLPKSLAVLGGGIIAVELGQFFARVGVPTTILQRGKYLVRGYDTDVSDELRRAFKSEGINVRTGVKLLGVKSAGKNKKITFQCGNKTEEIVVEEILAALGREPATDGLNLEKAGVELDGKRIKVDAQMTTSTPSIYAAGDVIGQHEVVHIAIQQAEWAARNAVRQLRNSNEARETADYRLYTAVTFTDPEIALVGHTEASAQQAKIDYLSASYPFRDHGKANIMGENWGFVKLLAEKSRGEIIGAQIIGPHASDLIHELIAVMRYRGTAQELAALPHYHPTLAEIVTYPAEAIVEQLEAKD